MFFLSWILGLPGRAKDSVDQWRIKRRWQRLQDMGMHIGENVNLPPSTWIDSSHCFLISIGDLSGFGEFCSILAHDAQMDEFLDASRLGRVVVHESCHIGAHSVLLAGAEIGPRTLVGANSVVASRLPPDTVCAGNPAKVICTLSEYLEKHKRKIESGTTFPFKEYDMQFITEEGKARMIEALKEGPGYMVGGREYYWQNQKNKTKTKK